MSELRIELRLVKNPNMLALPPKPLNHCSTQHTVGSNGVLFSTEALIGERALARPADSAELLIRSGAARTAVARLSPHDGIDLSWLP